MVVVIFEVAAMENVILKCGSLDHVAANVARMMHAVMDFKDPVVISKCNELSFDPRNHTDNVKVVNALEILDDDNKHDKNGENLVNGNDGNVKIDEHDK